MIHWRIDNAGAASAFGLAALNAEIDFFADEQTVNTVANIDPKSTKPSEGDAV